MCLLDMEVCLINTCWLVCSSTVICVRFVLGSKAYMELSEIVENKLLCKAIRQLSPLDQTSSLESFHKVVCYFAPMSTHFFYPAMKAR